MPYLTDEEKRDLLEKVQRDYKGCPQCGVLGRGSSLADIVALPVMEKGVPSGIVSGNQLMPLLPVTCNQCGYVSFFPATRYLDFEE